MEIQHSEEHGVAVIALLGRLDELATAEVQHAFSQVVEGGAMQVVLDLGGVEYVSSSGLRVLLMMQRALEKKAGVLRLCALTPFVAEVFEVSNFDQVFALHPDRAVAVAAFAGS